MAAPEQLVKSALLFLTLMILILIAGMIIEIILFAREATAWNLLV